MAQQEGFPSDSQELAAAEAVINPDGTLNEDFLRNQYGLEAEDAMQTVSFGNYTGTVAQMLSDERCPVGDMVRNAYHEKGLAGVEETFQKFSMVDRAFEPKISETTREIQKKN